jgi:ABC-type polysaccharide/polyol phosphate transport system ATPase subunit
MDEVVIAARDLGKMYMLYNRPQDRLKQALFWRLGRSFGRPFWALKEVSFEVRRGETFGIIGRNGSGKSTLLQLLAGILQPTHGTLAVRGRVAALLELGSGFNPDYTGRENVFLNASVLGLARDRIEARFDAIAAFADIGEFIDQPVKLYSSGMFVRLAFAVATSVDADVLLIDEALAVGDVFFRQKCYRRLEDLREQGASIVLVSHAMTDVEQFCRRALLLQRGQIVFAGNANEAVKRYYLLEQTERSASLTSPVEIAEVADYSGANPGSSAAAGLSLDPRAMFDLTGVAQVSNGWAQCTAVALCDSAGQPRRAFLQGETAVFHYEFEVSHDLEVPLGGLVIRNDRSIVVHGKGTLEYGSIVPPRVPSGSRLYFRHELKLELAIGEYTFLVGLAMLPWSVYQRRGDLAHAELEANTVRLCHLPAAGHFAIQPQTQGRPVRLSHHGLANLPGRCELTVNPG